MDMNKSLIALALSASLTACGGSSGDDADTTAPVISLNGNSTIEAGFNSTYDDAGATATDAVDGSVSVTASGTVDTSTGGTYTITYTATDAAGNVATVTRTVTVVAPVETVVEGKAIKGVLTNAVVTVFKFVDGEPVELTAEELVDANVVTDDQGNYTFTVLDYDGPIKVVLSPSTDPLTPTTMTCDAPAGCGDTAFGAEIDLTAADPDFELAAISVVDPESEGEVKVNVSALTHLASVLIEDSDAGVTSESVADESSKIANTFGIEGDITTLEPTVTTDASSVAGEDNADELKYGLINAGIMEALFSGETDDANVLSEKLAEVATDLVENDGALLVNQDDDEGFELAIADVLDGAAEAAATAAEEIAADDSLEGTEDILAELAQEETNLENEKIAEEALVGDDGRSQVGVDVPTDGGAVEKAEAMVNDVRLFSHLFDIETDPGAGAKTQGDEYLALMDEAGIMIDAEADSFTLLAKISDALAELSLAYDEGTLSPEIASGGAPIPAGILSSTGTGTITFDENTDGGGVLFSIDAIDGDEIVKLDVSAEFTDEGMSITLNIDGSIESAGAKFTINEGSKAVLGLDSAASRQAFDDDTFEGDIVSGELKLDIELAQKATEAVTNPITFSGMLHTELLLVGERVLDERWEWDDQNQTNNVSYGRASIDDLVLPEMLTLSGSFSALEGDLIKATLTVNVNNLAEHEAPEFKYIGKEVADIIDVSISADLNTVVLTEADSVSDFQQSTETRIFTPGTQVGEWSATSSVVAANTSEHYWGTGIERKLVNTRFSVGDINEQGLTYTRAYVNGAGGYGVRMIRFTPVDTDQDNSADYYQVDQLHSWDDMDYDGTSIDTLIDGDGNLKLADGTLHTWDNAWQMGVYSSINDFMMSYDFEFYLKPIVNPLTVTNGAELLAQTIGNWWQGQRELDVEAIGSVGFFFNEEELEELASGDNLSIKPVGYVTAALIADAFSVTVNDDSSMVSADLVSMQRTYDMDYTSPGNFVFARKTFEDSELTFSDTRTYSTKDIGLDVDELTIIRVNKYDNQTFYRFVKVLPVDDNQDGKADYLQRADAWSEHINDNGELTDEAGNVIPTEYRDYADTYDAIEYEWLMPFNPFTVTNALEAYQEWIKVARGSSLASYIDDIGFIETMLSDEEISDLSAGTTTLFDGYNIEADSRDSLEDAENFLDINAALTLEAILGEYEVKIQLSGDRTSLEEGEFNLEMVYKLPDDEAQRSFTVHANTEQEDTVSITNSEEVTVTLTELSEADEASGEEVIGTIVVGTGEEAEQAAQIVNRDGLILIVYANGTVETL